MKDRQCPASLVPERDCDNNAGRDTHYCSQSSSLGVTGGSMVGAPRGESITDSPLGAANSSPEDERSGNEEDWDLECPEGFPE